MITRTKNTFAPPIPEAKRWLDGVTFPEDRPLINLSQAAPVDPPPAPLRRAMAEAMERPDTHLYGPVLGNDSLRDALAENWSRHYGAPVAAAQTAITQGCNQAFAATLAALTTEGDEVILPLPWYFNHKMWLDMIGAAAVPLPVGENRLPDPEAARALITPRTRGIALVTPNNPTGAEYPAALLDAMFDLCAEAGIALIVDETYRDFDSRTGAPHDLFTRDDWDETFIHLYSFSKAFRLTGHRIGALIASAARIAEIEKFLDTMTICPARIGQIAALAGLRTQADFVAAERVEFLARRACLADGLAGSAWEVLSSGAYFAYLRHPCAAGAEAVAQRLVEEQSLLALPGTMFAPPGDADAERTLRIAFANVDRDGIAEAARRLRAFEP